MSRPEIPGQAWAAHGKRMIAWLLALAVTLSAGAALGQEPRPPDQRQRTAPLAQDSGHEETDTPGVETRIGQDSEREARRQEADPQREATPQAAPEPAPRDSEPRRPAAERGGTLMDQGPSTLMPPTRPPDEAVEPAPAFGQLPASERLDVEPGELLLLSHDMAEAMASARQLAAYQLRIKRRQSLERLGLVISLFRLPAGVEPSELLAELRGRFPDLNLDVNHRYRLMASPRQRYGQAMIGLPPGNASCLDSARIGLLDSGVNLAHPALAGHAITQRQFAPSRPAPKDHGTAIASLWVGDPDRGFTPLLRNASLAVAAVFRQRDDDIDTTTDALAGGLDWLLGQDVDAINLSLGGRENRVLGQIIQRLLAEEVLLVAAAGNLGPEGPPVFPAAYPGVVAVTAVDANRRHYPLANRGDYIDFAGPGVNIWAANETGTAYHTGTSFAVPFVLVSLLATRQLDGDWLDQARQSAIDLGPSGRDSLYGWGLVQWPGRCG